MQYSELLQQRHSCRKFLDRPVPEELIEQLIHEALLAPMAGNRQNDRQLIVVSDREKLNRMSNAVVMSYENLLKNAGETIKNSIQDYGKNFYHFSDAPTVIFLLGRREPDFIKSLIGENISERFHGNGASVLQSGMILQLSAENHGLGSCMMTGPLIAEDELKRELNINERWRLFGLISIGYKA